MFYNKAVHTTTLCTAFFLYSKLHKPKGNLILYKGATVTSFYKTINMRPFRKVKNKKMPLKPLSPKVSKRNDYHGLKLVSLCFFVPLGINYTFRTDSNIFC